LTPGPGWSNIRSNREGLGTQRGGAGGC
jgi:hypothetical protein